MDENCLLRAEGISKYFPGVQALKDVDFELKEFEVHALVGENGAGKSTLMNILSGVIQSDAGKIILKDKEIRFKNPLEASRQGVGIVFQELSLILNLSVAENIFPGRQKTNRMGMIDRKDLFGRTKKLLSAFGEDIDPAMPVKYLSIAKQQVVEILKAMSHNPRILILDEPTSSLTHQETERLFKIIRQLRNEGIAIIYISHHLQEIFKIADRATVLRDGKYIKTVIVDDVEESDIVSLMVGRKVTHEHLNRDDKINRTLPVLQVRNLCHKKYFKDISFKLYKGEIVGFAGLIGAGRSEIARTIFGLDKKESGRIYLNGEEINPYSPASAMKKGIAYTSESRKLDGLFLDMTIAENCIAPQLEKFSKPPFSFLDEKIIAEFTEENLSRFKVTASSRKAMVRKLSGGNQQKILLSMWLGIKPEVLIVDEPTKGVDVGAKSEIFSILRQMADTGVAVMVISSDLLEIIAISDRVIIAREGRLCGELHHSEVTEESVIAYASGVKTGNNMERTI